MNIDDEMARKGFDDFTPDIFGATQADGVKLLMAVKNRLNKRGVKNITVVSSNHFELWWQPTYVAGMAFEYTIQLICRDSHGKMVTSHDFSITEPHSHFDNGVVMTALAMLPDLLATLSDTLLRARKTLNEIEVDKDEWPWSR